MSQHLIEVSSLQSGLPEGFVGRAEAARMLGVAERTLSTLEKQGRVNCGQLVAIPGKPGNRKIYPVEVLERLVGEFQATRALKASELFPPPGFLTREQTSQILGIKIRTLCTWEKEGRFKQGIFSQVPGKPGRCRLYPIEEVKRLAQEHLKRKEIPQAYPDPDRPHLIRVPVKCFKTPGMEAILDAFDLPLVQNKRFWWGPCRRDSEGSVICRVEGAPRALHQLVMGIKGRELRIGHLNGNPLDCRRENLVVRTASQQKAAVGKVMFQAGKICSSRFKGVSRVSPTARWTVSIKALDQRRQLGRFRSEIAAALAYDDAARQVFGIHAKLNFPNPDEAARMRAIAADEENAAPPPFPPPGFIDRRAACRLFGIGYGAWMHWERTGRVRCGKSVPRPFGKPGRCRIYPIDELNQLLEKFNNVGKPYPDPERRGCFRVPIRSLIHRVEAIIDAEDLPLVEGQHWNWAPKTAGYGARIVLATTERALPLSRIIARVSDPAIKVSHVNRDPLDCRRVNLILRTMAEQAPSNRKMGTVNGRQYTSNFKGVSWDEERGKWKAQISSGDIHRQIGRFGDEIAAAEAYDAAARELFGEHAYLNFPDGVDAWLEQRDDRQQDDDSLAATESGSSLSTKTRAA